MKQILKIGVNSDIHKTRKYDDDDLSEVIISRNLQDIPGNDRAQLIFECHRVLKPCGYLTLKKQKYSYGPSDDKIRMLDLIENRGFRLISERDGREFVFIRKPEKKERLFLLVSIDDIKINNCDHITIAGNFAWTQTPFYLMLQQIQKGIPLEETDLFQTSPDADLCDRRKVYVGRFREMKKRGYAHKYYPIQCAIDRWGRIVLFDGFHRLAMAKALGYNAIYVKIMNEHEAWAEFQERLDKICYKPHVLYQPIEHPSFESGSWEIHRDYTRNAHLAKILSRNWHGKRILDIGCQTGYYSRLFNREGATVFGIDSDGRMEYFFNFLNRTFQTDCYFIKQDVVEFFEFDKDGFDLILCLSVIHWFREDEEKMSALIEAMIRRSNEIILDIDRGSTEEAFCLREFERWGYIPHLLGHEYRKTETKTIDRHLYFFEFNAI